MSVFSKAIIQIHFATFPAELSQRRHLRRNSKLEVEDEFLMVLMKRRLGLFHADLACRFDVAFSTVTRIFYSWIQFMYLRLGSINIFPHRDVIISVMNDNFKANYPSSMLIIDCTEIKVEMPSSLVQPINVIFQLQVYKHPEVLTWC